MKTSHISQFHPLCLLEEIDQTAGVLKDLAVLIDIVLRLQVRPHILTEAPCVKTTFGVSHFRCLPTHARAVQIQAEVGPDLRRHVWYSHLILLWKITVLCRLRVTEGQ